ncbi:hypothetical protein BB558_004705 [Smittium angustum]|uniref:PUM-HD domain-containing protein n=1 Tax=Smittium angustum TaxID=133377 RepID=A0A2U1J2M7_SMIAN|nr:hypothetical protein BB558_004705 [Smittium angustum]
MESKHKSIQLFGKDFNVPNRKLINNVLMDRKISSTDSGKSVGYQNDILEDNTTIFNKHGFLNRDTDFGADTHLNKLDLNKSSSRFSKFEMRSFLDGTSENLNEEKMNTERNTNLVSAFQDINYKNEFDQEYDFTNRYTNNSYYYMNRNYPNQHHENVLQPKLIQNYGRIPTTTNETYFEEDFDKRWFSNTQQYYNQMYYNISQNMISLPSLESCLSSTSTVSLNKDFLIDTNKGSDFTENKGKDTGNVYHVDKKKDIRNVYYVDKKNDTLKYEEYGIENKMEISDFEDFKRNVIKMSTDLKGSKKVQQILGELDEENLKEISKELEPYLLKLVANPFGNYVIQKIIEITKDSKSIIVPIYEKLAGSFYKLSKQVYGCRVVQKLCENPVLAKKIFSEIKTSSKNFENLAFDINGNHVVQKLVQFLPIQQVNTMFSVILGKDNIENGRNKLISLSLNSFGCHLIQRFVEVGNNSKVIMESIEWLLEKDIFERLVMDQYGNYVIQHILEYGNKKQREEATGLVKRGIIRYSKNKFASNVVEKSLRRFSKSEISSLCRFITTKRLGGSCEGVPLLIDLLKDKYGNYVVQKLFESTNEVAKGILLACISPYSQDLKNNIYSKQLVYKFTN